MTDTTKPTDERIWYALGQLGYENTNNYPNPAYDAEMVEEAKEFLYHEDQGDFDPCDSCKRPALHCICP